MGLVETSRDGDVMVVTLDDGKVNALSFTALAELNAAFDEAEADSAVKAVVLAGRDGKFSAGFDLSVMRSGDVDALRSMLGTGATLGLRIFMFEKPVVLAVTGHALAMGGILLTTADWRVGAAGPFKLGLNEVAIGMPVPQFATELCRNRLAKAWFTRCLQHAEVVDPQQAVEAGFLDEVVEPAQVVATAVQRAQHLADTVHPVPFAMTRRSLRGALAGKLRRELDGDVGAFDVVS